MELDGHSTVAGFYHAQTPWPQAVNEPSLHPTDSVLFGAVDPTLLTGQTMVVTNSADQALGYELKEQGISVNPLWMTPEHMAVTQTAGEHGLHSSGEPLTLSNRD